MFRYLIVNFIWKWTGDLISQKISYEYGVVELVVLIENS